MNALCLVVLLAVAAVVSSEQCSSAQDCTHVLCDDAHTLACVRRQCTCSDPGQSCTSSSTCQGRCLFGWHCVDGGCHCGFGITDIIGGIGK
uniref:Scsi-2 n=1 Tax=Sinonovacula constricta TaxID=98310 RepID=A0A3S6Q294_SINCO|nr:Scsi-2 [Sinonovacula constricta]